MPTATSARPPAAVGERVVEQQVHRPRPERQQAERDGAGEAGDREHGHADRAAELVAARGRLQPREVGEQRALDRLEELQRRAGDQQRVEDEAGDRRVRRRRVDGQHRGVEQRLLGEHDREDRDARSARRARAPSPRRASGSRPRASGRCRAGARTPTARRPARRAARRRCRARRRSGPSRSRPRPRARTAAATCASKNTSPP